MFRKKKSLMDKLKGPEWRKLYHELFIERKPLPQRTSRPEIPMPGMPACIRHHMETSPTMTLLVSLESQNLEAHQDLAGKILQDFQLPGIPFAYIPAFAMECETKEHSRVLLHLSKYSSIGIVEPAQYLYIPEMEVPSLERPEAMAKPQADLWNLNMIGADIAWQYTKGKNSLVAVVDTGIDYSHPQLKSRFREVKGINLVRKGAPPMDGNGHGTHVAGTIAGAGDVNGNIAGTGIAPDATLYAVKVLTDEGWGSEAAVISGIEWCIDNQVDVINMSLGASTYTRFLEAICKAAYEKGLILAAAAGNDGTNKPQYPAHLSGVLAVAAVDRFKQKASFSNWNSNNDISAPGVQIISTFPGNRYAQLSGTSMASPHVAGSMALARALAKESPKALEQVLKETAEKLGSVTDPDNWGKYGAGLVRADRMAATLGRKGLYAKPAFAVGGRYP